MSFLNTPPANEEDKSELENLLETGDLPEDPIPARLMGNKVLVFNKVHGSLLYGFKRFYGTPVGIRKPKSHIFDNPLELTVYEAYYLLHKGIITLYKLVGEKNPETLSENQSEPVSLEEFKEIIEVGFPQFDAKYAIYEDLREKKYVPRPGQKFGADFIVYEKGPGLGHSSFCIKVRSGNSAKITSLDVVTAGRLATSVRKNFMLANPNTKTYYKFKWFKP